MRDILKGMRIGLGILLMAGAGLLATVTLPTFTSGENLTAAKLTSAFAALKDAIENINVDAGKSIRHDGTPVWGYLDDGTPVYAKRVSVTWTGGKQTAGVAHGIANANTDKRIIGVTWVNDAVTVLNFCPHAGCLAGWVADDTHFSGQSVDPWTGVSRTATIFYK